MTFNKNLLFVKKKFRNILYSITNFFLTIFQHAKKKQRVRVVEYWIETARECFNIGNFNSLMAIIAGLNMSPISRLKKTVRMNKFSSN